MTMIPHFDLPFRFRSSLGVQTPAVVDQDSDDDIANCVLAAVLTRVGWRPEAPTFGTTDLTFQNQPVDLDRLVKEITTNEPRAALMAAQNPDAFDALIDDVLVQVGAKGS